MTVPRFNPPPGWPLPPGWQPDDGWTPDPAWPPAPPGWQFWLEDHPTAPRPDPAARRTPRWPWIVATVALVTTVVLAVSLIAVLRSGGSEGSTQGSDTTAKPSGFGASSTIELSQNPFGVTFDIASSQLFVLGDRGISVVDPRAKKETKLLTVPTAINGDMAVDPVAGTAWVSVNTRDNSPESRTVSIVDTQGGQVIDTVTLPHSVTAVGVDQRQRRVFAVHRPDDQTESPESKSWVTVFDADDFSEIATLEIPVAGYEVIVDAEVSKAVISGWMGVTILSTDTLDYDDAGVNPRSSSTGAAIDFNSHTAYVLSSDDFFTVDLANASLISTSKAPAEPGPGQLAVDGNADLIALGRDGDDSAVMVIDPDTRDITASRALGSGWTQIAVNPGTGTVFAATPDQGLTIVERA